MRWRAFYANGDKYSSAESVWRNLPSHGLVRVFWWDEQDRRHREDGTDAIFKGHDEFIAVNVPSTIPFQSAAEIAAMEGALKWGQELPPQEWARLVEEMDKDNLPPEG